MKKQSGLTLIEVLIASMILFMALSIVAVTLQQNMNTQRQAQKYMDALADYPSLNAQIAFKLKAGETEGEIEHKENKYFWRSDVLDSAVQIMDFNPETGNQVTARGKMQLVEITIQVSESFDYSYRQMVWKDNAG